MSWSVEDSPHLTSTQADSTISSTEVERYVDDGFLVVENLVGEEDRAAVLAEVERFARGEYKTLGLPVSSHPPVRHQDILAIHFPHWVSPTLRSMILHPRVVDVVRHIAAAHLAHWDGRAKCMQSMLFVKPPGMPGQAWHQDAAFHSHAGPISGRGMDRARRRRCRERLRLGTARVAPNGISVADEETRQLGVRPERRVVRLRRHRGGPGRGSSRFGDLLQRLPTTPLVEEPKRQQAPGPRQPLLQRMVTTAMVHPAHLGQQLRNPDSGLPLCRARR